MLYTIEEVHCVGACGMAPVVMINDRAHGRLTPERAVEVVRASEPRSKGSRSWRAPDPPRSRRRREAETTGDAEAGPGESE